MSTNMLAEETVRITVEGMERAEQRTDALGGKFKRMSTEAKKAEGFIKQLSDAVGKFAKVGAMFSIGGALGIGGIAAGALQGTVQGERLSRAMQLLARVLGDQLAPYVEAITAGVVAFAQAWASLSQETRESVTMWALIGTGIAGVIALLPAIIGGVSAIAGAFAALFSPAILGVAAIAAVTAAVVKMFNYFQSGSADAADAMQESNQGWIGSLISGVQSAVRAIAEMFNFIMRQAAKVSDWIAKQLANAGEFLNILPAGTSAELDKMEPIKAPQIDIGKVDAFFDHVKRRAEQAGVDFDGLAEQAGNIGKQMQAAFNDPKNQHLQIKMSVGWESIQGTFDRLQKAFADSSGMNFQKAQLGELQKINQGQQAAAVELGKIADQLPMVR